MPSPVRHRLLFRVGGCWSQCHYILSCPCRLHVTSNTFKPKALVEVNCWRHESPGQDVWTFKLHVRFLCPVCKEMSERSDSEWHASIGQKQHLVYQKGPVSPTDPLFLLTTLLKQEANLSVLLCQRNLCLYVKQVAVSERLNGSNSIACRIVGFPLGAGPAQAEA